MAVRCETPKPVSQGAGQPELVTLEMKLENAEFKAAAQAFGVVYLDFASGYRTVAEIDAEDAKNPLLE